MKHLILAAASIALLAACDPQTGKPQEQIGEHMIKIGQSNAEDVKKVYGLPDDIWEKEDGTKTYFFPKGSEGARTFAITLSKEDKVTAIEQVLSEKNFAKIQAGMPKDDVRRMLGKPRKTEFFQLKNEEVWDYRYLVDANNTRLFNVHIDRGTGKVTTTSSQDDPKMMGGK
ncbi:MAG: outer membrane protein assembly factor BamE domain-containing protein [Burkholderiaceae bacterium]